MKRGYRQSVRAESTARTRERILDATDELFTGEVGATFTLEQVADRAGVTAMTVLRHFGSRDGLIAAGSQRFRGRLQAERDEVPTGDIRAIAAYLDAHYEQAGRSQLRLLALEETNPAVAATLEEGRLLHRRWVARVLAPHLAGLTGTARARRTALLVVATDLLTWRLLRLEQGLDRPAYRAAVLDLLAALSLPVPDPADPPPA